LFFDYGWVASDHCPRINVFTDYGTGGHDGTFSKSNPGTYKRACANPSSIFDHNRRMGQLHLWVRYIVTSGAQKRLHTHRAMRADLDTID
jgi:hypothetical protein